MSLYTIVQPLTEEEVNEYYRIRFEVLRKPWDKSESTTKDETENSSLHFLVKNEKGQSVGTGRMQINSEEEAQVRSMAVLDTYKGKGIGSLILNHIEQLAKEKGIKHIVLDARENAINFYEKNGYTIIEKSYLLFETIQHYKMKKIIEAISIF